MKYAKRIRDLAIETLIAVGLVSAFVIYLFLRPRGQALNLRPLVVATNTAIVFGYLLSWFRFTWKSSRFWAAIAALLLCHLGLCAFIFYRPQLPPLAFFAFLDVAELVVFSQFLNRFILNRGPERADGN
jgi:hypothetical protein